MMVNLSSRQMKFPFDHYLSLSHSLPDYDHEWNIITVKIILVAFAFLIVIPTILRRLFNYIKSSETKVKEEKQVEVHVQVPMLLLMPINIAFVMIIICIIFFSPNNITTARHVYQAPLLKPSECQAIIDMGHRAAARNSQKAESELNGNQHLNKDKQLQYKKLLQEPKGWKKDRHTSYPTVDLNLVLDFENEDLEFIQEILNARLSPLLERIYGVTQDSIRANDMFLVRYDGEVKEGEAGQQSLPPHTDYSHLSFNILLNDDFTGGGTRYYNRFDGTFYDAKPDPGDVLINNAMVMHEGLPTTKGTRYILVGFMNVDHINPWTGNPTKVPKYSTFLSLPWLTVTLMTNLHENNHDKSSEGKQGKRGFISLSHSEQMKGIIQAIEITQSLGDKFAPHGLINLVKQTDKNEYIDALERFYEEYQDSIDKSIWFKGQMMFIDFHGKKVPGKEEIAEL